MGNERDLSQDGANEVPLSRDMFSLRLTSSQDNYKLPKEDFAEIYDFVKDLATSHLNIGYAGIIAGRYNSPKYGQGASIDLQFGPMANFRDVVEISSKISSIPDLRCTSEVCVFPTPMKPGVWTLDKTLEDYE